MVSTIDGSNFKAVLLFATVLFPYSCVTSVTPGTDLAHAFDCIVANLVLTRRTRPMVDKFFAEMKASELGHLIPAGEKEKPNAPPTPPFSDRLTKKPPLI